MAGACPCQARRVGARLANCVFLPDSRLDFCTGRHKYLHMTCFQVLDTRYPSQEQDLSRRPARREHSRTAGGAKEQGGEGVWRHAHATGRENSLSRQKNVQSALAALPVLCCADCSRFVSTDTGVNVSARYFLGTCDEAGSIIATHAAYMQLLEAMKRECLDAYKAEAVLYKGLQIVALLYEPSEKNIPAGLVPLADPELRAAASRAGFTAWAADMASGEGKAIAEHFVRASPPFGSTTFFCNALGLDEEECFVPGGNGIWQVAVAVPGDGDVIGLILVPGDMGSGSLDTPMLPDWFQEVSEAELEKLIANTRSGLGIKAW